MSGFVNVCIRPRVDNRKCGDRHDDLRLHCVRCGYVLHRDYAKAPGRMCDKQDEAPRKGLGDYVADGLAFVGITKPVVTAVIGPCGCEQRQEALNELGKRIGL